MATPSQSNVAVREALEITRTAQNQFWREALSLEEALGAALNVNDGWSVCLDTSRDFGEIDAEALIEECRKKYKEHCEDD